MLSVQVLNLHSNGITRDLDGHKYENSITELWELLEK